MRLFSTALSKGIPMPIKKLTFSWDVPITTLLGLIASGQADLRIDVLGDDKPVPLSKLLANGGAAALLEGPKPQSNRVGQTPARAIDANGNRTTGLHIILTAMARDPDHAATSQSLKEPLIEAGLKPGSASPQLSFAKKQGWAEQTSLGRYKLTNAGIEECKRRNIQVYVAQIEPPEEKPKPPKQKNAPAKRAANGVGAHHG
jgi:hypothetical protein